MKDYMLTRRITIGRKIKHENKEQEQQKKKKGKEKMLLQRYNIYSYFSLWSGINFFSKARGYE